MRETYKKFKGFIGTDATVGLILAKLNELLAEYESYKKDLEAAINSTGSVDKIFNDLRQASIEFCGCRGKGETTTKKTTLKTTTKKSNASTSKPIKTTKTFTIPVFKIATSKSTTMVMTKSTTKSPYGCNDTIAANKTIYPVYERVSCSGCFLLVFNGQGQLVVYQNYPPYNQIWSTGTTDTGIDYRAEMKENGVFAIYYWPTTNVELFLFKTDETVRHGVTGAIAMIQDDGQFVVKEGETVRYSSGVTAECVKPESTSTTVDYTTAANSPCGTFIKYNPKADPKSIQNNLDKFGLFSGVDYDKSFQYVGYGYCDGRSSPQSVPVPGYISTNSSSPGAFVACSGFIYQDRENSFYLQSHPELKWVDTDMDDLASQPNVLSIGDDRELFFGRVFYRGRFRLGTVQVESKGAAKAGLYIRSEKRTTRFFNKNFQVLTCSACSNRGAGKFCCLNGE